MYNDCIQHHGILGQKWGVRRFQNADGTLTVVGKERYYKLMNKEKLLKSDKSFRNTVRSTIFNKLKNSEDMRKLHEKAKNVEAAEKEYDEVIDNEYEKAMNNFRNGKYLKSHAYKLCKDAYGTSEILNSDNPIYRKKYAGYDDGPEYRKMYLEDLSKISPNQVADFIDSTYGRKGSVYGDRQFKEIVSTTRFYEPDFDPKNDPVFKADRKWSKAIDDLEEYASNVGQKAVDHILGSDLSSKEVSGVIAEMFPGTTYSEIETSNLLYSIESILNKEDGYYGVHRNFGYYDYGI